MRSSMPTIPRWGIVWLCTLARAGIARAWRVLAYRKGLVIPGLAAIRALEIADYTDTGIRGRRVGLQLAHGA